MTKFKALLFDADDTLLDSSECERQALIYLFGKIGLPFNNECHEKLSSISLHSLPII